MDPVDLFEQLGGDDEIDSEGLDELVPYRVEERKRSASEDNI